MLTQELIEQDFQRVWQTFDRIGLELDKVSQQMEKTDQKFDKYFGKVKELDRNWGTLVEALVRPSVGEQFRKWGIPVQGSGQRIEREQDGETIEIDILLQNGDALILVEVKTTLRVRNVDEHIAKHLQPFKRFFPEYRDRKIYGAVAYIQVEEDADRYAYQRGLFVLTFTTGDLVKIKNDKKFVPKCWEEAA